MYHSSQKIDSRGSLTLPNLIPETLKLYEGRTGSTL